MVVEPDGRVVTPPPEPVRARSGCRKLSFALGQNLNSLNTMRSSRLTDASTVHRRLRGALALSLCLAACHLAANASADGPPLSEIENRVDAALSEAEAALDREEARLDELAAQSSGRTLADGRPSFGQVAANIRLLDRRIRELDAGSRKLRGELQTLLASLDSDIAAMAQRLSSRPEQTAREGIERAQAAGENGGGRPFRDCSDCPEMIAVPSGSFEMGSRPTEEGRHDNEGPVRAVTIGYRLAVGVDEVTRGEFASFVSATSRAMGSSCWSWQGKWQERAGSGWSAPGFSQDDQHPVTCVSWNDAKAYARWLSERTGKPYRLLSEAEWEYAARAGTTAARYWGTDPSAQCQYANGADASTDYPRAAACDDGYARTSPVGSYDANGFGLRDVLGNVFEWVEDCWNGGYDGAPSNGGAWETGDCDRRVFRGGAWLNEPRFLRSAFRVRYSPGFRSNVLGFRVARTLDP